MEIKGKVVIVTGASQGIGLATARLLSENGAKVVLAARSEDLLKNLESEIEDSYAIVTDMMKEDDIKNMINKTIEKYGRVDILINNAGRGMHGYPVEKTNVENYKELMELNVFSIVRAMQEVIPHMKKQGSGMIINISSRLSKMYVPYLGAYSSTKYALNSISLTAREELKKDGIIVSIVLPGMTETNFSKNSIKNPDDDWAKRMANSGRPMPTPDTPEKVAETILKAIETEEGEVEV